MGEDIPTVEPENEPRPTIAFRPNSVRQKAEWERAAEQSDEYSNVSHLIRKAVKRELAGEYDRDTGEGGGVSDRQFSEMMDTLESLEGDMNDLSSDVSEATTAMYASETNVSEDTTTAVYAALPTGPEQATTAEGVAAGTDVDPDTARVALGQLAENHPAVKRIELEKIGDDTDSTTVEWDGSEIEIQTGAKAIKRGNPLFFKKV